MQKVIKKLGTYKYPSVQSPSRFFKFQINEFYS